MVLVYVYCNPFGTPPAHLRAQVCMSAGMCSSLFIFPIWTNERLREAVGDASDTANYIVFGTWSLAETAFCTILHFLVRFDDATGSSSFGLPPPAWSRELA